MVRQGLQPACRYLAVVLSNGATVQLRTAVHRLKPFISANDAFNHSAWEHKAAAAMRGDDDRERSREPDFSAYYRRFAGGDAEGGGSDSGGAAKR